MSRAIFDELTPALARRLEVHSPDEWSQIADDDYACPEDRELGRLGLLQLSIGRGGSDARLTDLGRNVRRVLEAALRETNGQWPDAYEEALLVLRERNAD